MVRSPFHQLGDEETETRLVSEETRREDDVARNSSCVPVSDQKAQAKGDVVGLSAVTVSELEFGACKSGEL